VRPQFSSPEGGGGTETASEANRPTGISRALRQGDNFLFQKEAYPHKATKLSSQEEEEGRTKKEVLWKHRARPVWDKLEKRGGKKGVAIFRHNHRSRVFDFGEQS